MEKITYRADRNIDPVLVSGFLGQYATWKVHSNPEDWMEILKNSSSIISAWDDDQLVGFARGISDQVRYAQVLDVLIHPDYRRKGIGKELVFRLIDHPAMCVRGVILGTPSMKEFYESAGFKCVNDQAFMMVLVRDEYGEGLIQPVKE